MKLANPIAVCCATFVVASFFADSANAQTILNGSLEGPVTVGNAPPNWFNWQKTPDTVDALGPFNNTGTPWTLSPDGGTFVRAGGSDFANSEAFAQVVTGFTIGQSYTLNIFQTNLGFEHPTSGAWIGEVGNWEFAIDGSVVDATSLLTKQALPTDATVWSADSLSFVATATTHELAFISRSVDPLGLAAYMGIDGLRFQPVPSPSALPALALGGLAMMRRRRVASSKA